MGSHRGYRGEEAYRGQGWGGICGTEGGSDSGYRGGGGIWGIERGGWIWGIEGGGIACTEVDRRDRGKY